MRTALRKRLVSPASAAGCPPSTADRAPVWQGPLGLGAGGGA